MIVLLHYDHGKARAKSPTGEYTDCDAAAEKASIRCDRLVCSGDKVEECISSATADATVLLYHGEGGGDDLSKFGRKLNGTYVPTIVIKYTSEGAVDVTRCPPNASDTFKVVIVPLQDVELIYEQWFLKAIARARYEDALFAKQDNFERIDDVSVRTALAVALGYQAELRSLKLAWLLACWLSQRGAPIDTKWFQAALGLNATSLSSSSRHDEGDPTAACGRFLLRCEAAFGDGKITERRSCRLARLLGWTVRPADDGDGQSGRKYIPMKESGPLDRAMFANATLDAYLDDQGA